MHFVLWQTSNEPQPRLGVLRSGAIIDLVDTLLFSSSKTDSFSVWLHIFFVGLVAGRVRGWVRWRVEKPSQLHWYSLSGSHRHSCRNHHKSPHFNYLPKNRSLVSNFRPNNEGRDARILPVLTYSRTGGPDQPAFLKCRPKIAPQPQGSERAAPSKNVWDRIHPPKNGRDKPKPAKRK